MSYKRRFDKMRKASASMRSKNFMPGLYLLTVEGMSFFASNNPKKKGHDMHVVNFKIDDFRGEKYFDAKAKETRDTEGMFQAGGSVSSIWDQDDEWGYGPANSKEFICHAIMEMKDFQDSSLEEVPEAFDDEEFGDVFEKMMDDDAFVGLQLVAQVSDTSNDDEKNFFKPFWTPFSRSDVFSE